MVSVIIPFYNEAGNLRELATRLLDVFGPLGKPFELIFVDDGSTDGSVAELDATNPHIKIASHRKRLGKGKALRTAFSLAEGEAIVFMDADLQDDPEDVPKFLEALEKDVDFVNGWRTERLDPIGKTLPSSIFNFFLLKLLLRSKFHDVNCGFKAMKREVLETIPLYGDNYRFLPILADKTYFRATEIPVKHHPRTKGKSKFGFFRIFSGFFDSLTTYFILRYSERPFHFFAPIGGTFFLVGFLIDFVLAIEVLVRGEVLSQRPILFLGILLIIVGIQILMTGVISELVVYLHKKSDQKDR